MKHFRDLNLRFASHDGGGGNYRVWVEGEMAPDQAAVIAYDPAQYWEDAERKSGGLIGKLAGKNRRMSEDELYKLGELLADLALPAGPVRTQFEKRLGSLGPDEGLRLRLRIDPVPLRSLPWEYMAIQEVSGSWEKTDFLVLRRGLVSIVRTDTVPITTAPQAPPERIRLVSVLSSPEGQAELDLPENKAVIMNAVAAFNEAAEEAGAPPIAVSWVEAPATAQKLAAALADPAHIFDFAGHGILAGGGEGLLILEGPGYEAVPFPGDELARLLATAGVRLAFLGACETGRQDGENVWAGVAPALSRQKIPAALANQYLIADSNATILAAEVYPRILAGDTIDEAVYHARSAILRKKGLTQRDWGVPVIFLHDEDGVLFRWEEAATAPAGTGPTLDVIQSFKRIRGKAIQAKLKKVTGGRITVEADVETVEEDGEFIGIEIDNFGGN